ncbi:hypothetical protein YSY22_14550 [Brevibacillus formosus]
MQEVFSCIDFDAVLKSSFPHRHPDPVIVTDPFMELVEEVLVYVCKVDDNTLNRYSDPFHVPPPPEFFHEFRA